MSDRAKALLAYAATLGIMAAIILFGWLRGA
jgi:hypothetical protein